MSKSKRRERKRRERALANVELFPGVGRSVLSRVDAPNEELIDKINWLLAEAKSGRLRQLSYAGIDRERCTVTGWVGHANSHDQIAAVSRLHLRTMIADFDGN